MTVFTISDLEFVLSSAVLDAYIDDDKNEIVWGIQIEADATHDDLVGETVSAKAETLLLTKPGELAHWSELAGRAITWTEPYDEDEEHRALLYLFEHTAIYESKVELFADGLGELAVRWTGQCDLHWKDGYNEGLPFSIETPLTFTKILFGRRPESQCWANLAPFFCRDLFEYKRTEHGVSTLIPRDKQL